MKDPKVLVFPNNRRLSYREKQRLKDLLEQHKNSPRQLVVKQEPTPGPSSGVILMFSAIAVFSMFLGAWTGAVLTESFVYADCGKTGTATFDRRIFTHPLTIKCRTVIPAEEKP